GVASYRRALELKVDYAEAQNNLGSVLRSQGKFDEAVGCFLRAPQLQPDFAPAHVNLGNTYKELGKLDESVISYRQAIALGPGLAEAYSNLGNVLKDQGQLSEALTCYRRAIELQPNLSRAYGNLLYTLYFCPEYDAAAIHEEHRRWNEQHAAPLAKFIQPYTNDRSASRRLRVGYMSPDFREHAQSFFTVPLFGSHDHQQFEIFCYSDVT